MKTNKEVSIILRVMTQLVYVAERARDEERLEDWKSLWRLIGRLQFEQTGLSCTGEL
jgi:hypothetical protein